LSVSLFFSFAVEIFLYSYIASTSFPPRLKEAFWVEPAQTKMPFGMATMAKASERGERAKELKEAKEKEEEKEAK
jgi:hypothetical protein